MENVDFAKIIRKAGLPITNEIIELREMGIENYLKEEIPNEKVIGLVQIYYTGTCDNEIFDDFVKIFNENDNTFSDDLAKEIQVLAGLVLYEMIIRNEWENTIALSEVYFLTYNFLGYKQMCLDVFNLICDDFDNRRIKLRENISFERNTTLDQCKSLNFEVSEEESVEYNETVVENLNTLVHMLNEVIRQVNNVSKTEYAHASILYEDSQLLWWFLTGMSDDLEDSYLKLGSKKAAILVGKDLAKRVSLFPGPYAIKTLLIKMLDFVQEQDNYTFDEYIESIDDDIISGFMDEKSEVDTPILYALKKKEENGSGSWQKAFSKRFSEVESEYTAVDIAYETYLECLVLKAK